MDIKIASEVISYLNTEFDSHDFIRKLLEKHPEVYGRYLVDHGNVATADGEISSCRWWQMPMSLRLSTMRTGFITI